LEVGDGPYDPDKVFDWIKSRVGKLEAIVFSGGEALMQGDATINYMQRVRDLGFNIGLHTNGFYPALLKAAEPFVDWIGLDFKATKQQYKNLTGIDIAYDRMIESLKYWIETGRGLEVRTTCDPRFVSKEDLLEIAKIVSGMGAKNFAVQKYTPYHDEEAKLTTPAQREQFFNDDELKKKIESLFDSVVWRNN
jgi:pyruvate formate lyase activating enzyme